MPRKPVVIKPCETCAAMAVFGERFCVECRKRRFAEMEESGYLERRGFDRAGMGRTSEQRENVYETKHGTGHG